MCDDKLVEIQGKYQVEKEARIRLVKDKSKLADDIRLEREATEMYKECLNSCDDPEHPKLDEIVKEMGAQLVLKYTQVRADYDRDMVLIVARKLEEDNGRCRVCCKDIRHLGYDEKMQIQVNFDKYKEEIKKTNRTRQEGLWDDHMKKYGGILPEVDGYAFKGTERPLNRIIQQPEDDKNPMLKESIFG